MIEPFNRLNPDGRLVTRTREEVIEMRKADCRSNDIELTPELLECLERSADLTGWI
jgi:hypothetical protein